MRPNADSGASSRLWSVDGRELARCWRSSDGAHDVQHQPVGVDHEEMPLAIVLVSDLGCDLGTESLRPLVGLVDALVSAGVTRSIEDCATLADRLVSTLSARATLSPAAAVSNGALLTSSGHVSTMAEAHSTHRATVT